MTVKKYKDFEGRKLSTAANMQVLNKIKEKAIQKHSLMVRLEDMSSIL